MSETVVPRTTPPAVISQSQSPSTTARAVPPRMTSQSRGHRQGPWTEPGTGPQSLCESSLDHPWGCDL